LRIFENFKQTGITRPFAYALNIGFFAGLFWSCIRLVGYYCHFTNEPVSFLLKHFLTEQQLTNIVGNVLGTASFILFSMLAALIYMWLFRNLEGPWPGLWYGLGWWGVLFGAGPFIGITKSINGSELTLVLTDLCVFIVWGLFIGYSIAFEFTDESSREPAHA